MATTRSVLLARITSLCAAAPFGLTLAVTPFDFDQQPVGNVTGAFRIEPEIGTVIGGLAYSEERTDLFRIWVAQRLDAAPHVAQRTLLALCTSLTAAIVRDGSITSGEYHVPDEGQGLAVRHDAGQAFAVAELALPINYESQL